jgi:FkbM family methyltransferase
MKSIYNKLRNYMNPDYYQRQVVDILHSEVVEQDFYNVQAFAKRGVELATIIDLGANIGFFTVMAHSLYPWSKIISLEPYKPSFEQLVKNCDGLNNIHMMNNAYGDGGLVDIKENGPSATCCFAVPGTQVQSLRLSDLPFDHSKPYMIKSDCEGGEVNFYTGDDFEIVKGASVVAMEGHYHPVNGIFNSIPFYDFIQRLSTTHQTLFFEDIKEHYITKYVAINKDLRLPW